MTEITTQIIDGIIVSYVRSIIDWIVKKARIRFNNWWRTLSNVKREIITEGSMTLSFFVLVGLTILITLLIIPPWLADIGWILYGLPIIIFRPIGTWISKSMNPNNLSF